MPIKRIKTDTDTVGEITKRHLLIFMKRRFCPCNSTTTRQPLRIHSLIIENYKTYLSNMNNEGRIVLIFKDDSALRLLITITHLTNKDMDISNLVFKSSHAF